MNNRGNGLGKEDETTTSGFSSMNESVTGALMRARKEFPATRVKQGNKNKTKDNKKRGQRRRSKRPMIEWMAVMKSPLDNYQASFYQRDTSCLSPLIFCTGRIASRGLNKPDGPSLWPRKVGPNACFWHLVGPDRGYCSHTNRPPPRQLVPRGSSASQAQPANQDALPLQG